MFEPATATLWFAGKELFRDKKLQDTPSIGKNERTTVIVKISKVYYLASLSNILVFRRVVVLQHEKV